MTTDPPADPSSRALGESLAALAVQVAALRGQLHAINTRLDQAGLRPDLNLSARFEWHHTYGGKRPDLAQALEFYDRWLPNTMRRITAITRNCAPQCVMLRSPGDRAARPRYR